MSGYASHSNAQARVQWLATPLSQPYPLQLASRVDQVRNSAYMGSNCQPHGQQSNAYTHQTKVVVIISSEMCVYMPQNIWKHQRTWNSKFQKYDLFRYWTEDLLVVRVIPGTYTTRLLVDTQEHQNWIYKLDLTSSCQSSEGGFMLDRFFSLITDTCNYFIKTFRLVFKIW